MAIEVDQAAPHQLTYAPPAPAAGLARPTRVVAIGYLIWGLVLLLFAVVLGCALIFVGRKEMGDEYPMMLCVALAAAMLTALTLLSAYGMFRRRWRRFSIVVAILNVCVIGFGTLFGGLALYMLLRRGAGEMYGEDKTLTVRT